MKCGESERMLFLYREGELTAEEARELGKHLAVCPRCAQLAASTREEGRLAGLARRDRPAPADSDALTRSIMRRIDAGGSASRLSRLLDRIAERVDRPRVRLASAVAICAVTAVFLVQQVTLALSLMELERRVSDRSGGRPAPTLVYSVGRDRVPEFAANLAVERVLGPSDARVVRISDAALRSLEGAALGLRAGNARAALEHLREVLDGPVTVSVTFTLAGGS